MLAGFGTAVTGYYTPFVYAGSILMSIGTGLLTTVQPHLTSRALWIGFQILCGVGIGFGEEQGIYMIQTTLPEKDVAIGVGMVFFAQTFGGALFVSVAQAVFLARISTALEKIDPGLDPRSVLDSAYAGSVQTSPELRAVYAPAIKSALRVGLILAAISSLGALLYDWKSLKAKHDGLGNEGTNNEHGDQEAHVRPEEKK